MWKNIVERGRPHGTIWRMRIACWIPTATNTHTGCVILIAFTLQQWLHERASMLCYTYIACLVLSVAQQLRSGLDRLIGQGFRSNTFRHTHTPSEWSARRRCRILHNIQVQETNVHTLNLIRTCDPSNPMAADLRLRRPGHRDGHQLVHWATTFVFVHN